MQEEWWERPTCWLCNYGKAGIFVLLLGLAIWLSRGIWGPVSPPPSEPLRVPTLPSPEAASPTPFVTFVPPFTPSLDVSLTQETTPVPPAFGYRNQMGKYQLNYPSSWQGVEIKGDVQFRTPRGAMVYVHVETGVDSLEQLVGQEGVLPYSAKESTEVAISAFPALCQTLIEPEKEQIAAVVCYVVAYGNGYILSVAELDILTEESRKAVIAEFMDMVASFQLIP